MGERFGQRLGVVAPHVVVITGALLTVAPIAFMIYSSFKTTTEIFYAAPMAASRRVVIQELRNPADQVALSVLVYQQPHLRRGGDGIRAVLLFAGRLRLRQV